MYISHHLPSALRLQDIPEGIDLPQISTSTGAGILVAIAGNILISLALNCQKLAHKRLEREREATARVPQHLKPPSSNRHILERPHSYTETAPPVIPIHAILETEPLLQAADGVGPDTLTPGRGWFFFRRKTLGHHARDADTSHLAGIHALMPVEAVPMQVEDSSLEINERQKRENQDKGEGDYLRSKLWWLGFLLMNLGETGNFISYAFAPASVVAPLGTVALIANCMFAPLMLKERFRKRDFLGIIIAILGAVTVVLSANPSDSRLNPDGLIKAITQRPFEIYTLTYIIGIVLLSGLSEGPAGRRWVFVDVGLCALFGGFTVLSTKAVSTLLTMEWFEIFKEWITYPVIAVLLGTGIGQIRYLNRALMRFDSKIVVPTQFVMFNLSAIVGSALLYGDFKKATFHQLVTFLYGCGATFTGVFIIAWAPSSPHPSDRGPEEEEDDAYTLPGSASGPASTATITDDGAHVDGSIRTVKGSLAKPTLIMPEGANADASTSPALRSRRSVVSLYGFSPAQRVLLISSSPRDEFVRPNLDPERYPTASPESIGRQRGANWFDDDISNRQGSPHMVRTPRYGATTVDSTATSRNGSRLGDRDRVPTATTGPTRSRSRSASPDPFR